MEAPRTRRRHDHRLRRPVRESGDIRLAVANGVPRSTARDGSRLPAPELVTLDLDAMGKVALRNEIVLLRKRYVRLVAAVRLVVVVLRVCGVTLARRGVPDGSKKKHLLTVIERSRGALPQRTALRLLGLSSTRVPDYSAPASHGRG